MLKCAPSAAAETFPRRNLESQSESAFSFFSRGHSLDFVCLYSSWPALWDCSLASKGRTHSSFLPYLLLWFGGSGPSFPSGFGKVFIGLAKGIGMAMTIKHAMELDHTKETRKSGFGDHVNFTETLGSARSSLGQLCPQDYPHSGADNPGDARSPLGEAMDITGVAELLGCSPWTVRQRYVPAGLPHIRASAKGHWSSSEPKLSAGS